MPNEPKQTYEIVFDELGRAIWHCDYYGAYGNHFVGTFVFKPILSVLEEIAVDRLTRQLLGNDALSHIDPVIEKLSYALASLKYRVIKAPPFWMDVKTYSSIVQIPSSSNTEILYNIPGGHIDDAELIFYVYGAAIEAQLKFKEKIKQKSQQAMNVIKKHVDELQQNNANIDQEDKEALEAIMQEKNEIEGPMPKTVTKTYTHLQDEDE